MTEGVITTDLMERKRMVKEYYKQCYKYKFDTFDVMNTVLDNTNYQNSLKYIVNLNSFIFTE